MPVASSASIKGCRTWELPDPAIQPRWGSALLDDAMNGLNMRTVSCLGRAAPCLLRSQAVLQGRRGRGEPAAAGDDIRAAGRQLPEDAV